MQQIKILLSSVLTLLLITGNKAYAAPHYTDFGGRFQDKKPSMNVFKGQVKKGNVFKLRDQKLGGDIHIQPNRGSYTDSGRVTYIRPGKDGFIGEARIGQTGENCLVGGTMCSARKGGAKTQIKFRGKEGQSFSRGLHNNGAFRERESGFLNEATIYQNDKDRFIGETGLSDDTHLGSAIGMPPEPEFRSDDNLLPAVQAVQVNDNDSRITFPDDLGPPGIVSGTGADALQQPKGVPLQFINGEWR